MQISLYLYFVVQLDQIFVFTGKLPLISTLQPGGTPVCEVCMLLQNKVI